MSIMSLLGRFLGLLLVAVIIHSKSSAQWQRVTRDRVSGSWYVFATEDILLLSETGKLNYWSDADEKWYPVSIPSLNRIYFVMQRKKDLLAMVFTGSLDSVFRSNDNGRSWIPHGVQPLQTRTNEIMEDGPFTYLVGSTMSRLQDSDSSWEISSSIPRNVGDLTSICQDDKYYHVGTDSGGMLRSSDKGKTWSVDTVGIGGRGTGRLMTADGVIFGSIKFDGRYRYANGVFRSTNRGNTWIRGSATFSDSVTVAWFFRYGWVMFASTDRGVYRTTDGGATWEIFNQGFPEKVALAGTGLAVYRGYLYAIFYDQGMFRMPLRDAFPSSSIAYSNEVDHPFHLKSITDSNRSRSLDRSDAG